MTPKTKPQGSTIRTERPYPRTIGFRYEDPEKLALAARVDGAASTSEFIRRALDKYIRAVLSQKDRAA